MAHHPVHYCPRCKLCYRTLRNLTQHLRKDHDVPLKYAAIEARTAVKPVVD